MYSKICPTKLDFARSYAKVGRKMTCDRSLFELCVVLGLTFLLLDYRCYNCIIMKKVFLHNLQNFAPQMEYSNKLMCIIIIIIIIDLL